MGGKTRENLKAAFAGESQAHMKYLVFARAAERDGLRNIARLFTAVSFAEQVHAMGHLNVLSGKTTSAENLTTAIGGETYEVNEMYPGFIGTADAEGDKAASGSFRFAIEAEKQHAELYKRAKEAAGTGKDLGIGAIHVCPVCGHTVAGDAPDKCPVCGAKKEAVRAF